MHAHISDIKNNNELHEARNYLVRAYYRQPTGLDTVKNGKMKFQVYYIFKSHILCYVMV